MYGEDIEESMKGGLTEYAGGNGSGCEQWRRRMGENGGKVVQTRMIASMNE